MSSHVRRLPVRRAGAVLRGATLRYVWAKLALAALTYMAHSGEAPFFRVQPAMTREYMKRWSK